MALDSTIDVSNTTDALADVRVVYCAEEPQARRLLAGMAAIGMVAIDIETAPHASEIERLDQLLKVKAEKAGGLKARRKLKAPAIEIAALVAEGKRLAAEIRYARTAGLDPRRARIRLLQVYDGGGRVLVIDLDRTGAGVLDLLDGVSVIAHNAGFEMPFLEAAGVALGPVHCTLQACRLMLGEHATSLADGAAAYLNLQLDKTPQTSDWNAPHLTKQQIEYAAIDAVVAWRLAGKILPRFDVQRSAYEIQVGVVPAAMRMAYRGFKLDIEAHARLIVDLKKERLAAEQEYREACMATGHTALADRAPSTPAQKAALLTALLSSDELARWRRTEKSGALSTRRSELLRAGHYPPILALVKIIRIDKLLSSFGATLAVLVSPVTTRIHAHYQVAAAATGRATCSGPNLQQIPRSKRFRKLFIPEPSNVLVVADYSSMELRAAAYISGDRAMTEAFEQGLDLHKITAARMTGKTPEDVTDEERRGAKAVNFGAAYGIGAVALVQSAWDSYGLVLDVYEAKRWLGAFVQAFPTFARWRTENFERCAAARRILIGKDAAQSIGRVFPFSRLPPDNNGYTHCCNMPVQGACADASMLALAYADDRLFEAKIDGGPVAWLHDEIVLEVRADQADLAAGILKQAMIDGFAETFPGAPLNGLVEPHIGSNWGEAKSGEIRAASGATPEPDFAPVYERVRFLRRDVGEDAARARALEHVVAACDGARPADIGRGRPEGFPEASGAGEAHGRVAPTFYEFFAGGGMARAGLPAGWKCSFANDIDPKKGASYRDNFGGRELKVCDVADLTLAHFPGGAVDLAWASFPCQDLSEAGQGAGLEGFRSNAIWPCLKLIEGLRAEGRGPKLIVLENVTGLLDRRSAKFFDAICDTLACMGCRYGAVAIDASLFLPQSRERVFVLAVDEVLSIPAGIVMSAPAAPFHPPALIAALKRQKGAASHQLIWWRFPVPPARNVGLVDLLEDDRLVPWDAAAETMKKISMMAPVHLARVNEARRAGKRVVKGLFRRTRPDGSRWELRDDDIAGCLRVPSGGSSRQSIVVLDSDTARTRLLTPRECARLMGLDDGYRLPVNTIEALTLAGDGVVVPVVRHLAEHILEPILATSDLAAESFAPCRRIERR